MTKLFSDNSNAITDFKESNNLSYISDMLKFRANITTRTTNESINYESDVLIPISGFNPYEIRLLEYEGIDVNKFPTNFSDVFGNAFSVFNNNLIITGSHPTIGSFGVEIRLIC